MKVEALLWVLILVSLALAILSRKYRTYGLTVVGLAVVSVVAIILLVPKNDIPTPARASAPAQLSKRMDFEQLHVAKLDQEDPEAKNRIDLGKIRFGAIRPSPASEPGTFESIRARLFNESADFTLTDFAYVLTVQDCLEQTCSTVYQQRGLASTMVPAQQARDVTIEIRTAEPHRGPAFRLRGTPSITLSLSGTRAYKAADP